MRLVFVSSTFKDMQFERDELKNRVAPRIDSFLSRYGENVHFGDLRWGVNTAEMSEEESSKKVLKVCLDEIDDCRPYMIVFIGERYGWIPSQDLILEAARARGMGDINPDISVTNLEIEYGALLNPDFEGRILFYFRNLDTSEMDENEKKIYEAESSIHKEKLDALKKQILEKYPGFVRFYDAKYDKTTKTIVNLNPVMEEVYNDLCRIFKIDLDKYESLPNYQRVILGSHTRFEKHYKDAYYRNDYEATLGEWNVTGDYLKDKYNNIPTFFGITGPAGSGKKTYLSLLYKKALEDKDIPAYPFVVGLDEYTKGAKEFKDFLIAIMEKEVGEEEVKIAEERFGDMADRIPYLASLMNAFDKGDKKIRFFIMNCNDDILGVIRLLEANLDSKLTSISFNASIEMEGALDDYPLPFWVHNRQTYLIDLSEEDKLGVIHSILKSKHKELPSSIINLITTIEKSGSPLYLSLIIERLLLLDHQDFENIRNLGDGMVAIEKYMTSIVNNAGKDIKAISKELLKELKERINPEMIPIVIRILSYDFSLTNKEIEQFFHFMSIPWNEVDFSLFIHSIPSLFKDSSIATPYLSFKIPEIKEAAKELVDEWGIKDYSLDIIRFLEQKEEELLDKDVRLIEAYRVFNQKQKSAEHYIHILNTVDPETYSTYEDKTFEKLALEFNKYLGYYIDVYKLLIDDIALGKIDNFPYIVGMLYQIMDVHFTNSNVENDWCKMVVELIGYTYNKYEENKDNNELFFFLMLGLYGPVYLFNNITGLAAIDDDDPYLKPFKKANAMLDKTSNEKRYQKLSEEYEEYLNFSYINNFIDKGSMIQFSIALIDSDESYETVNNYFDKNDEYIDEMYDETFDEDNENTQELLGEGTPTLRTFINDNGYSLFLSAAKFVQLMNDYSDDRDEEYALAIYYQYTRILEKYVYKLYFFNGSGVQKNMGLFLFGRIVVDFLLYATRLDFEDEEHQAIFNKFSHQNINYAQILCKLYLATNYIDAKMVGDYLDLLLVNDFTFGSDSKEDIEEEALNFSYISEIVTHALMLPNPKRTLVEYCFIAHRFIDILFESADKVNKVFINRLQIAYFYNLINENYDYDDLADIVANYLRMTEQEDNVDFIKEVHKEVIDLAFEDVSYREFKTAVNHHLK